MGRMVNNPTTRNRPVPYPVIVAASKGDPTPEMVLAAFQRLHSEPIHAGSFYDERGNVYYGVDEDIRERLQARLMRAILTFRADE